jgi:FkbM family methyltransferase
MVAIEKVITKKLRKKFFMGEQCFHIYKNDVIMDVGACTGDMSLYYSWKVGIKGRVIAIEPEENNFKYIQKLKDKYNIDNITLLNLGVYKEDTEGVLYNSKDNSHHSIYREFDWNINNESVTKQSNINLFTIDSLCKILDLKRLDYIVCNIEGAELDALLGAKNTLEKFHPKIQMAPHSINNINQKQSITDYLIDNGYIVEEVKGILYGSVDSQDFDMIETSMCENCGSTINRWESARFDGVCLDCYTKFTLSWFKSII